jgi:hypothetical protein
LHITEQPLNCRGTVLAKNYPNHLKTNRENAIAGGNSMCFRDFMGWLGRDGHRDALGSGGSIELIEAIVLAGR